jgi:hypothetical protein
MGLASRPIDRIEVGRHEDGQRVEGAWDEPVSSAAILPPEAVAPPVGADVVMDRVYFGIGLVVGGVAAALTLVSLL